MSVYTYDQVGPSTGNARESVRAPVLAHLGGFVGRAWLRFLPLVSAVRRRIRRRSDRRDRPVRPTVVMVLHGQSPHEFDPSVPALFVGDRRRRATASDIAWLDPHRVVVLYLSTSALAMFDYDDSGPLPELRLRELIEGRRGLEQPDGLAVAPGGTWFALTNTLDGSLAVVSDLGRSSLATAPIVTLRAEDGDKNLHGVAISPDGQTIVYTSVDDPGGMRVVGVTIEGEVATGLELLGMEPNVHGSLKPKAVRFTPDGRFLVIGYGGNAGRAGLRLPKGFVEVRRFDPLRRRIGDVVSRTGNGVRLETIESVAMFADGSAFAVTDNSADRVEIFDLDPIMGTIGPSRLSLGWAAGGLSFPHGCALSPDQRWLAVTNYGDGSVRFFDVSGERAGASS